MIFSGILDRIDFRQGKFIHHLFGDLYVDLRAWKSCIARVIMIFQIRGYILANK